MLCRLHNVAKYYELSSAASRSRVDEFIQKKIIEQKWIKIQCGGMKRKEN